MEELAYYKEDFPEIRMGERNLLKYKYIVFDDLDIILPQKRGKFLISKGNGNMLTFGIIVPFYGNDIHKCVGY